MSRETPTRQCPFRNCARMIPGRLFACLYHWSLLTSEQQTRAYAMYDRWVHGSIRTAELRRLQQEILDEAQGATVNP